MAKRVILKIMEGDFETKGFQVALDVIMEPDRPLITDMPGSLPPAPDLVQALVHWQSLYSTLGNAAPRIQPKSIVYGGSIHAKESCREAAEALCDRLGEWLDADSFRSIDRRLRDYLSQEEPIRFLIRSQQLQVRQLPWHRWELIDRYRQAEVALSASIYERIASHKPASNLDTVKILAILGDNRNIDVETDRQLLENLPGADVTFLNQPERRDIGHRLWNQPWDILFFAGHSQRDGMKGRIQINPNESLNLEELKYGLRYAIAQGLQLAIFNSCDGLGLAMELENLHLPQLIVMREPVPDRVAHEFLKYFLNWFTQGNSLYLSVRQAREQLQSLEGDYPCASWLPIICQNSVDAPPTWQSLLHAVQPPTPAVSSAPPLMPVPPVAAVPGLTKGVSRYQSVLIASWLMTSLIMGMRLMGWLQPMELWAYDTMMRLRPAEGPDDRILLITVDEADLRYQDAQRMPRQGSLSDRALNQILAKLEPHQPRAIGLDIFRDRGFDPEPKLKTRIRSLITICSLGGGPKNLPAIAPPPKLSKQQIEQQLGFVDFSTDPDHILRRQTIGGLPNDQCTTEKSFVYQLAMRYLKHENLRDTYTNGLWSISTINFPDIENHMGGYHQSELSGYEIMLNYRSTTQIAPKISLTNVLNGSVDARLQAMVRDKVVIIGTIAHSFSDSHFTPYGELTGVEINAHQVSHLLSAVLDRRPVISSLPQWGDMLWIGLWSMLGGIVAIQVRATGWWLISGCGFAGCICGGCFFLFLRGIWLPVVPSVFALMITSRLATYSTQSNAHQ